jgi:hypothetical protein
MKRIYVFVPAALGAAALFAGLVYVVLRMAHVAEPAAITMHGATARRIWATAVVLLALAAAIAGGLAWARPAGSFSKPYVRVAVVVAGMVAAINGGLVLAVANGGPGTGNGVVGGAAALVLGVVAIVLGSVARVRVGGVQ